MTKLSKILDFIFGTIFVFLSVFIWTRYFVHNTFLTIFITSGVTVSVVGLFYFTRLKKEEKVNLTKKELTNANNCTRLFMLSSKSNAINWIYNILSTKYNVTKKADYLFFNQIVLRPVYTTLKIDEEIVLNTFTKTKSLNPKKIIICSKSIEPEALQLAKSIKQTKIILLNEQEFYFSILKPLGFECEKTYVEQTKKGKGISALFNIIFNRHRTKAYSITAIVLLLASFLMRYNLYYIIMASILSLMALFSYFNRPFNKIKKEDLLT